MTDRVGQIVGSYRLMRLLGEGGFAEVYLGEHLHLETHAAIKILHTQLTSEAIEAFRNEARIIARLEHPHIVRVFDYGVDDKTPFLVMSYAENGSLRQRHPRGTRLPLITITSYIKQLADALKYAHDQKLIHRDIKPENLLVGKREEILLSDFGIAVASQSSLDLSAQGMAGTISYMAPEQIEGKPRRASDQYSLGILVYEWLIGGVPFKGNYPEVAIQHLSTRPPSLRAQNPDIPPAVEEVVLKSLAKDPQQRFESVQAFSLALEQACLSKEEVTLQVLKPSSPLEAEAHNNIPTVISPQIDAQRRLHISRRAILLGLSGIAAAGGITYFSFAEKMKGAGVHNPSASASPTLTHVASSPTHVSTPFPSPSPLTLPLRTTRVYTFYGHAYGVSDLDWSPDGKRIASASYDQSVQIWDATTGKNVVLFRYADDYAYAATFLPGSGARVASGSGRVGDHTIGSVQVWDAVTTQVDYTCTANKGEVYAVDWSRDGAYLASCSFDHTVRVWNGTNGALIYTYQGHSGIVTDVQWAPGGTRLASCALDRTVQVWNATDGTPLQTYTGHTNAVISLSWSPDGTRIASGGWDNMVQVWDVSTKTLLFTCTGHTSYVITIAWSPDGRYIASCSYDHTVKIWDATTGTLLYTYTGHSDQVYAVAWSPDRKYIASGGGDKDPTVHVWTVS